MTGPQIIYAFLNPRGRSDRRGLLLTALGLLGLQAILVGLMIEWDVPPTGAVAILGHGIFLWLAYVAATKRLHDAGLSAWWIGKGLAATLVSTIILAAVLMCFLEDAAFETGGLGYMIVVAGNILPVFAMTLWLHIQPGQPTANAYGPVPGASGFSFPDDISHTSQLPA